MITRTIGFPRRELRTIRFGSGGGFACPRLRLHPSTHHSVGARRFHCSVTASLPRTVTEYLPCRPSASPFGLALGADSPRADWHGPGNLGLAAGGNRTPLVVTYTYICFSMRSSIRHRTHSRRMECSPTDTFSNSIPRLRRQAYTRLLSTPPHSTSELLRTL